MVYKVLRNPEAMSKSLSEIIYCSRVTTTCSEQIDLLIGNILTAARRTNESQAITGVMLYNSGYFVQVLEGPSAAVERLFARIRTDPRHHDIVTLSQRTIAARMFPDWAMGFVETEDEPAIATTLAGAVINCNEATSNAVRTMLAQSVSRSRVWGNALPGVDA